MKYTIEKLFISASEKRKAKHHLFLKLRYSCFTILCQFLLYNKVNTYIPFLLDLPLPHHRAPSKSSPSTKLSFCATEQLHTSYLLYTWYCISATTYLPLHPSWPPPSQCLYFCSLYLRLYSCPTNRFLSTTFLHSTYMSHGSNLTVHGQMNR